MGWATRRVNDGKGFLFVSHVGNVYPSGFLPIHAGNVKETPLQKIYQEAPIFKSLRDTSQLESNTRTERSRRAKHTPGASLVIEESPTGERHRSPHSCRKYVLKQPHGRYLHPADHVAGSEIHDDVPESKKRKTDCELNRAEPGFLPRRPSAIQRAAKRGANRIVTSAVVPCRTPAGTIYPSRCRSVWRSANRFSDAPPCSNPAKKAAYAANSAAMT